MKPVLPAPALLLPFELEPQQGHLQCWAAVAVSLRRYHGLAPVPGQQAFAQSLLGANCDQVCAPLAALAHAGLRYTESRGPLTLAALRAQLARGHPVPACLRYFIGWHLVVLHGVDGAGRVQVADPLHGPSSWPYRDVVRGYRAHYPWTHSYRFDTIAAQ